MSKTFKTVPELVQYLMNHTRRRLKNEVVVTLHDGVLTDKIDIYGGKPLEKSND